MARPRIGITVGNREQSRASLHYESHLRYSEAVAAAGGAPILLPHEPACVEDYLGLIDGLMLTGGADPCMEAFGEANHPKTRRVDPVRQAFELALLAGADRRPALPVLGICLGMQLMALHRGGRLVQHLPDVLGEAAALAHQKDNRHPVAIAEPASVLGQLMGTTGIAADHPSVAGAPAGCLVASWHHQAVSDPGRAPMRVLARAGDGVIEAIDDATRSFYLGVQWHPERGGTGPLNSGLVERFVAAARRNRE